MSGDNEQHPADVVDEVLRREGADCGAVLPDDWMPPVDTRRTSRVSRFRITIRGEQPPVELRGFVDSPEAVMGMSEAVRPWGVLIASLAPDDYSPFGPTAKERSPEVPTIPEPDPDTCEHGLSAWLCEGPGHYPQDPCSHGGFPW